MTQRKKTTSDSETKLHDIESDIDQTRGAISNDIQELGEKLAPDRLKGEAKQAISDTAEHLKGEAREVLSEAKDVAVDKFREAKQAAADSVTETWHDATDRVRYAGDVGMSFARANAVPLAFIGIGAAWLVASRRRANAYPPRRYPDYPRRYSDYYARRPRSSMMESHKVRDTLSHVGDEVRDMGERTEQRLREGGERARNFAEHEWDHLRSTSSRVAQDNPLATGMLALAAGVGVGLLLPTTEKENRVLGPQRERLLGQAREAARQTREAADEMKQAAKTTARDVKQELTHSPQAPKTSGQIGA